MVEKGLFRRDLYHRLRVGHLRIVSLRERGEDIVSIANLVLHREAERKKKRFKSISPKAMEQLYAYPWPGNVREMENTIKRAVLMYDGDVLLPAHLYFLSEPLPVSPAVPGVDGDDGWIPFGDGGWVLLPDNSFDIESLESFLVRRAIERFGGNKSKEAAYLGLSRLCTAQARGWEVTVRFRTVFGNERTKTHTFLATSFRRFVPFI
jgi:DNA-binding NtrC family response regulator